MSYFINKFNVHGNVTINVVDRNRERSPSPGSVGGSVSSTEVERKTKFFYFGGKGEKDWSPKEELVVNDFNITKAFKTFRESSILKAEEGENLNCLRILSLSHVFPLNKFNPKKCITRYLNEDGQEALKSLARQTKPVFLETSDRAVLYCHKKMIEAEESNNEEDEEEEEDEVEEEEDEEQKEMFRMVKDLVKERALAKCSIAEHSEAAFTVWHVFPPIKKVLMEELRSENCFAMFDKSIENGKKPDFILGTTAQNNKIIYFFFVEVKRPDTPSKYQAESDFAKLMKLMKTSIDAQLSLGVKVPISLGLLVEGFRCTLFQMMQVADGVYLPSAIRRFALVSEDYEIALLPLVVEALYFVKLEFRKFVAEVDERRTRAEKDARKARICHSFDTRVAKKGKKKAKK